VLLPAIEGTVSVDENGDIDVEKSPCVLPDGAGSVKIGNAARSALAVCIGVLVVVLPDLNTCLHSPCV
jgi:hypothetical protein